MTEPDKRGVVAHAIDSAGNPVALQSHQVQSANDSGWAPISAEEAGQLQKADNSLRYVDENYGALGKAALGAANGLTLGLGPAAAVRLGALDPSHLDAASQSGAYLAGDIAGTLLPAFLSGGESLAGRAAVEGAGELGGKSLIARALGYGTPAGLMGEAGGLVEKGVQHFLPGAALLGDGATGAIKMAARGATEGALMNIAHQTSQDLIQDKPLTAQALVASGIDGALFGGLAGGALGGAGAGLGGLRSLGGRATEELSGKVSNALSERAGGFALGRLGSDLETVAKREANMGVLEKYALGESERGTFANALKNYKDLIEGNGAGLRSTTHEIQAAVQKGLEQQTTIEQQALRDLDASSGPGNLKQTFLKRLKGEIDAPVTAGGFNGDINHVEARSILDSLDKKLAGSQAAIKESEEFQAIAREHRDAVSELRAKTSELRAAQSEAKSAADKWAKAGPGDAAQTAYRANAAAKANVESLTGEVSALKEHVGTLKKGMAEKLKSGGPKTWADWASSRESLAEMVRGAPEGSVRRNVLGMALNDLDDEMVKLGSSTNEELFKKYAAAATQKEVAKGLLSDVGNKLTDEAKRPSWAQLTSGDMGMFGFGLVGGNPLGAAGIVAGRKIMSYAQDKLQPVLAEYAARSALGTSAAAATAKTGMAFDGAIRKYLNAGTKNAVRVAAERSHAVERTGPQLSYTMRSYREALHTVDELTSPVHQMKVQQMAQDLTTAGHPELAKQMVDTYMRASQYLETNRPKVKTTKEGSLRKLPSPVGLDAKEMKFLRITAALRDPVNTIVDGLENGNLSRDAVAAIKYVAPELHQDFVFRVAQTSMELKAEGKYVPADKLATLGVALDAPVDTTLTKDFIDAVQQSFTDKAQAQAPEAPSGPSGNGGVDVQNFQTPLQTV